MNQIMLSDVIHQLVDIFLKYGNMPAIQYHYDQNEFIPISIGSVLLPKDESGRFYLKPPSSPPTTVERACVF